MNTDWGDFLNRLIYKCDSSASEIAHHIKVSPQYIYSLTSGNKKAPKIKRLNEIYDFLNKKKEISRNDKLLFFYLAMKETIKQDDLDLIYHVIYKV